MRKNAQRTMNKDNLVKRLVGAYPDSIICIDGELDYENTLYNMAAKIIDTIDEGHQISIFGKSFCDENECYNHLIIHVSELREYLENYIHNDI